MAYVSVPKDLTKVKSKVVMNLTKRQLVCFGSGAAVGVPLFLFAEKQHEHQRCGDLYGNCHAAVLSLGDV